MCAWEYTPYEISLLCEFTISNNKRRIDELLFVAWHTEAFARQKRLPNLDKVLRDVRKPKRSSKSDEILKAMAREKGVIIK